VIGTAEREALADRLAHAAIYTYEAERALGGALDAVLDEADAIGYALLMVQATGRTLSDALDLLEEA
jgi:hypothetical protein